MSKLGYIDIHTKKPMMRLQTRRGDYFNAVVDTGFNRQLITSIRTALKLGAVLDTSTTVFVDVAGEKEISVIRGGLEIDWVSGWRHVSVLAYFQTEPRADILIGTGLLYPDTLTIKFGEGILSVDPMKYP